MTYFTQQGQEASREQQQNFCADCGAIIVPFSDSSQESAAVSLSKSKSTSNAHDESSPSIAKPVNVVSPFKQIDSTNNVNASENNLTHAMPVLEPDSDDDYDVDESLSETRKLIDEFKKSQEELLDMVDQIKNDPFVTRLEMTRKFFTYD